MFDDDNNQKGKDNRGDKKSGGGGFNLPVSGLLVWIIIIAVMIGLFFMKGRYTAPAGEIQQSEFLSMFDSNQVATATIVLNQQALPLCEIKGAYYGTGADGKLTKTEVPFVVHNAWLTSEMVNNLARSSKVKISSPNVMLMNVVWGL